MIDHFRTVGFTLEPAELQSLVNRAVGGGTEIVAPSGVYRVWTPGAGAELWLNIVRDAQGRGALAGANPHFAGDARVSAIVEAVERNADFPLEGEIYAWASRRGDEHGLYPFSASIPDFDATVAGRELPFRATLALAGFAHEFAWWPTREAYDAARERNPTGFAETSFVPTGLFGKSVGRARSHGLVAGTIVASESRVNPATERLFRCVRIATDGGEIDVVAAPDIVEGVPAVGGVVRASCWLTARIADERT